ncbi:calcium/calmodulin-dependent protein kinase type, putative [Entamoeba invadens IP1]|uniref:non-specific serine/threonine protein kinase n=1 Tax=Entamoeba invadens IP1 TaxID=370355 RepID=L7FLV6_ENTIV|nr:calcium/calmodulin-dependent protein kinase type, putative [Entamoeba invadens IP1]ELP84838.1 calcium/calmodulin-dependent protein kinase type, putative [Entamoeba invadens IP1]|eukprot:XP_004184184.1 calcium/calmodulin-dependent protein kinase type, putative [Entamoeba invadens IP1]
MLFTTEIKERDYKGQGTDKNSGDFIMSFNPIQRMESGVMNNETLFILILSFTTVLLGFIVIVMLIYINYIQRKMPSSVPGTPQKAVPKDMNYIGEQFSCSKKVLGHGSLGTVVFEGTALKRKVAVKRMVKEFFGLAENEIKIINMTDERPHLVRYYGSFSDDNFVYLAITYCPYTLDDYLERLEKEEVDMEKKRGKMILNEERIRLMKECAIGIYHLHKLGIVHRDIKPFNVLVDAENGIRITDFGLAKKLDPQSSSFSNSTTKGSVGWQAPEMLNETKRLSKAVDIFTLGCLFYYIGCRKHPYGEPLVRQNNILKGTPVKMEIENNNVYMSEFIQCFHAMNSYEPSQRLTIEKVLSQPLFWSFKKRLDFLQKASDLMIIDKNVMVSRRLDNAGIVIHWDRDLSPLIIENNTKFRYYDFNRTIDLLRLIRNQSHHYYTLQQDEKDLYKSYPDGFYQYYQSKFPSLCVVVYSTVLEFYADNPVFADFFEPNM